MRHHKKVSGGADYNRPFCYYHIQTPENPKGTDCTIRIQEGIGAKCPFSLIDLYYKKKKGCFYVRSGHFNPNPEGDCPHIIVKGLTPELSDKVKDVHPREKLQTLLRLLICEEE
jgi:hypothetical protein